ncbi:MAG TPA: right-handed parallel beta-helix repeat-containing protein [Sedimentisphaerales bacterium]|nr:right-handed parallel beta-helix repeat-containing protein [Phycisphaerae bacterium]HON91066.1 right-handed parallel beta-helix repeat-containing protein [Sedimentisphaerales bacterium]HQG47868.1 right-handed parallel beta-helix repeat-containing protein [Sedimentisphaerales bacterium]
MNRRLQERHPFAGFVGAFTAVVFAGLPVLAQPSGGPYGPIPQNYEIPANANHVYYVAPDGRDDAAGMSLEQPTTLETAIAKVVTGDAIILRGGVYRTGGLRFNQGITMQPYAGERPVLKGTRVATEWRALRNNVWRTSWKTLFPAAPLGWWQRDREGMLTPLHRFNNDMVFVDGEMLRSAGWEGELDPHSYYIDYDKGYIYIGVDPTNRLVEITAFDGALIRVTTPVHGKTSDRKGPVIRGITFTQYARLALEIEGKRSFGPNDEPTDEPLGPADPATYGKEVTGTTLENVTISFCSRVAGYFRGDGLTVRQTLFSDTSTEGLYVIGSSDVLLERNIFRRNNVENLTGYYPAAVKIFNQSHRVVCRDNLVMDNPNSNGVWYDVGNRDGVFVNNWVQDCQDGFFFEISDGAVCAGNVFVNCDKGIRILNSANVRVWHNTLIDSVASFERNERSATGDRFGWHPATGPDVDRREGHVFCGNLLVASDRFSKPFLRFEQSRAVSAKLTEPQVRQLDGNVYVRSDTARPSPLLVWSPVSGNSNLVEFKTLADFQKLHPQFEAHSKALVSPLGALFQSPDLKRYELIQDLSLPNSAAPMPDEVRQILGWQKQDTPQPGAYPARL